MCTKTVQLQLSMFRQVFLWNLTLQLNCIGGLLWELYGITGTSVANQVVVMVTNFQDDGHSQDRHESHGE